MKRLALILLLLAGCDRAVTLGSQTSAGGTTATFRCTVDSQCGANQRCLEGACQTVSSSCDPQQACATPTGSFCAESCPTCTSGERCCMDNGFGQCQCFCGLSCAGPSCAAEGVDPGPVGRSCSSEADCLCGESCAGGTCQAGPLVAHCFSASDCGQARASCSSDSCVNGRCVPPGWSCVNARECGGPGSGMACSGGSCVCVSHAGQACTDGSQCASCAGEGCNQGVCGIFTTTSGNTSTGSGNTSGGTSGGSTGGTTGGCTCQQDADCNDAYHVGYLCSGGFCVAGPSSATLSSTGGACAGPSGSSTSTSGTGTIGGSSGSVSSSSGGTT